MFWDNVYRNKHIMQEFEDIEVHKTSVINSLKMTWVNKQNMERLYLDREGPEDVCLDISPLPQHQIDGIRFLFRQFKKKKPGVILNNPEGYGKTLQVTLFLETIRKALDNPILILCENDRAVENWIQNLRSRTQYKEDHIVVDSPHVYVKKSIFLKKGTHLTPSYIRRDWDVVVVKNDFAPKELMRAQMKATYKIWMTTIDMRKDLHMFNLIYSWMYSEKKFNVESFLDSIPNCKKPLNRMKLLNAFMEDVVIVRNEFQPVKPDATQEIYNITQKVSRKNKDATGKKIKRTKKKMDVDSSAASDSINVNAGPKSNSTVTSANISEKKTEENLIKYEINDDDNKRDKVESENRDSTKTVNKEMDVESFIRDKKPIEYKEYEVMSEDNSMEVHSEALGFTEAVRDIVQTENVTMEDYENCKDIDRSLNSSNVDITEPSEEISEVDGKLSNLDANNMKTSDEKTEPSLSMSVVSSENIQIVVQEHNNNACKGSKEKNGDEDKSETENQDRDINKRNLDQKISEMEEKAMKKFKGSMLDNIF